MSNIGASLWKAVAPPALAADVVVCPAEVIIEVEIVGVTVAPGFPPPMVEVKRELVRIDELVPTTVVVLTAVAL